MTRTAEVLGNAPPRSLDSVLAALTRLRRTYDMDEETAQSRGIGTFLHPDIVRLRLIDELRDWLRPGVDEERRFYDLEEEREREEDRVDEAAKARLR